jgi:hypothetical protein
MILLWQFPHEMKLGGSPELSDISEELVKMEPLRGICQFSFEGNLPI